VNSKEEYEVHQSLASIDDVLSFIPPLLRVFLNKLFVGSKKEKKVGGIGQAIIQACRPRAIRAPLQLGLAIQLHHQYSSSLLIDTLYAFGFCSSYSEVLQFEKCAAITSKSDLDDGLPNTPFLQFISDNADHNSRTLDGKDTFHGMGTIVTITPALRQKRIPIQRRNVTALEIKEASQIQVLPYFSKKGSSHVVFEAFKSPNVSGMYISIYSIYTILPIFTSIFSCSVIYLLR